MKLSVIKSSFVLLLFVCLSGCSSTNKHQVISADVVIYGGTPAAITAAVELTRSNKHVVIVCPEKHLGGMSSNGLGFTDTGDKNIIGGIAKEFYQRCILTMTKRKHGTGNRNPNTAIKAGYTCHRWRHQVDVDF
ncbi:FAD-dependent oxidoreductase [Prolixibacter bellariivorans]|uniref:FAD-dependent oxidoreductase n=1 Tax=Prolixibacter bellariivorans TaxID=314319 RepID=UPI00190008DE|nr:FAD-dependent oxidoreductase [Prolixibacter bellariivorans]